MQVKFHTTSYNLTENGIKNTNQPDGSNVLSLELTDITDITALTEDATNAEDIVILNGSAVYQEYLDYTALRGVTLDAETGLVTVTVRQESLVRQVGTLRERNRALKAQVNAQAETIAQQGNTIESQATIIAQQAATIDEQAQRITELEQSQAEQDDEITEIQEVLVEE